MPVERKLSAEERAWLLHLARESIIRAVHGRPLPEVPLAKLSPLLRAEGASFVTLTKEGQLRGCIGALQAYQPLALDVREHAVAAALQDPRFPPVQPDEIPRLEIEISRLTPPRRLDYTHPRDLPAALRPGVDGVILQDGWRRATFLPQVWEQLPDAESFLSHLCLKMGAPADLWRHKKLEVQVYEVEEFRENRRS